MGKEEKRVPNYEQPFHGAQMLEPEQCKTCVLRDKTKVTINEKTKEVGWCKGNCAAFPYPDKKPHEVMHNTSNCEYYEKE